MKYLIITTEFPPGPGGIGKHAFSLAKALRNNGVEVAVLCNMDNTSDEARKDFLNNLTQQIEVVHIKRQGLRTYYNRLKTAVGLIRDNKYDKLILTGQSSIWLGWLLKRLYRFNIRTCVFVHGTEVKTQSSIKRYLTKIGLQAADEVYAVSTYTAALTRNIVNNKEVKVMPNGLDMNEWADAENVNQLSLQGNPKLLTVGSITNRKGQHNVIAALPEIIKTYPNVHYHMIGLPANKNAIIKQAELLGVNNSITIHGALDDAELKKAYKSADIFCMLSEEDEHGDVEGFGIAILEANINGIPAIGSNQMGITDAIENATNGYLVNPNNVKEIVEAISAIDNTDKKNMSDNCRAWAKMYDWNEIVKPLL
ncbi:MAG: glycosyltransferase family 4 protein [Bacteroidetes bacterium]|nr:glycosyltransferase family 4 protein [Bacteroidota bacterium]